ncbi:hypothetical protein GL218_03808 [Daldinia childiae]|uniref:uncharacterized protein n=1 Tax=Daldinia childiae TaxID=326645 RepID=UPI0014453525|nr:uncharacterized protein GL218_03808 [Daldinia childiae]KAF3061105.1 hypothetical protein GL218_03808 [Daldinia childiae]
MAKRTTKVPDAWEDDDWEVQADKAITIEEESKSQPQQQPQLSKAERLAQHAESNKKLWESAEAPPETFHYLAARSEPPLTTGFKPAVKVLSRKPVSDPNAGDDDEDNKKTPQLTPEEILAKQQREREEKQRRYDEARAKIFGTNSTVIGSSNPSSGTSTPGAVTPPRSAEGRGPRGRGRGGRGGGGGHRHNESRGERDRDRDSNIQRPSSQSGGGRELYDPNYSPKPGVQLERKGNINNSDGGAPLSRRSTPREEDQIIRAPRGPDGSGRGGFGFAKRGAKGS